MAPKTKAKTHKGLKKRVKITAGGKLIHKKGGKSHLLSGKPAKRRRQLRQTRTVAPHMAKFIRKQLIS